LIVAVNGESMRQNSGLETLLLKSEIGDTITLEYYPFNSTRKQTTVLTVGEEPPER